VLFATDLANIDSIKFDYDKPVADLLDLQFKSTGDAKDVSAMKNSVTAKTTNNYTNIYYSPIYKRYVARFENFWGKTPNNYYKVDYSNNSTFKNALADGHSIEAVVS